MNSIQPAIAELERAFAALSTRFPNQLAVVRPVITIQSARGRSAFGWHQARAWDNGNSSGIHEITICAEHLARSPEDIAGTLLHEMVHHWNAVRGIRDCSRGQYHNRAFRTAAIAAGLEVTRTASHGWASTSLGPEARAAVCSLNLKPEAFSLFRKNGGAKAPTKMLKWQCACTIVRCATTLTAVCENCGKTFQSIPKIA